MVCTVGMDVAGLSGMLQCALLDAAAASATAAQAALRAATSKRAAAKRAAKAAKAAAAAAASTAVLPRSGGHVLAPWAPPPPLSPLHLDFASQAPPAGLGAAARPSLPQAGPSVFASPQHGPRAQREPPSPSPSLPPALVPLPAALPPNHMLRAEHAGAVAVASSASPTTSPARPGPLAAPHAAASLPQASLLGHAASGVSGDAVAPLRHLPSSRRTAPPAVPRGHAHSVPTAQPPGLSDSLVASAVAACSSSAPAPALSQLVRPSWLCAGFLLGFEAGTAATSLR